MKDKSRMMGADRARAALIVAVLAALVWPASALAAEMYGSVGLSRSVWADAVYLAVRLWPWSVTAQACSWVWGLREVEWRRRPAYPWAQWLLSV